MKFSSIATLLNKYIARKAAAIDHSAIIKDITQEGEISAGYFGILTLANLIALSGLLQNSVPVVIGAMLISPQMGPILSFGFAFITGDKTIWRNSLKKIVLSVAITIAIASIATFFSPLKEITGEILARTKPNLYDLLIAFFSGLAGAVAICTKKSYLTIVPGVAIATAVIPPLSVTGFGLGTADFGIMTGSFLLFFTNFVAIVISTCIVFYMYGFKPSIITEADISALKKRVSWLAVVLLVISMPLIYTLQQSISEVRLRGSIKQTLKQEFDKQGISRLASFSYLKKDGALEINATINTVNYLKEADIDNTEKKMKAALGRDLKLYMEQIKVQPGGLKETAVKGPVAVIAAQQKTPQELIRNSRADTIAVVRQSAQKIEKIISPSSIEDFSVGFRDKTPDVSISLKIRKDEPLSYNEIQWLKKIFAAPLDPVSAVA